MGVLAKILGLGPLFMGVLIIACIAVAVNVPYIAPFIPYVGILLPAAILSILAWRRSYPSAISWAGGRWLTPFQFWHAAAPELGNFIPERPRDRIDPDSPERFREATLIFDDPSRTSGYAVKCLKVADIERNFETTTEEERLLLVDSMAKAIEGLGNVEVKLVVERDEEGERAHMLLYSRIVDGDEEAAFTAVESAAKTLATSLEPMGIILIDDAEYMGWFTSSYAPEIPSRIPKPSTLHGVALVASSAACTLTSLMAAGLGWLSGSMALAGVLAMIASFRIFRKASSAAAQERRWALELGKGVVAYRFMPGGILLTKNVAQSLYDAKEPIARIHERYEEACRYASFSENLNRDISSEEMDRRLPKYLEAFSNLIYSLRNFRIAIHIRPQPVGDEVKVALAKADVYGMDAQAGGAVSGYVKAGRMMNAAERMLRGERPYTLSGVLEVRVRAPKISGKHLDMLDKELHSAMSLIDVMNLRCREVRDGYGAMMCRRFMYLPKPDQGFLDPNPIPSVKALTRDFIAITPIAFRRRPVMPRDGLYWGRDRFGRKVYWNPETLPNPHILVLGTPGSGKSTLIKTTLFRLNQLTPYTGTGRPPAVIIIDPAGEYADKARLLRELGLKVTVIDLIRKKYNPLLLAGLEPEQRASRVVDVIFSNIMDLQPFQASILYQGIMAAYRAVGKIDISSEDTWTDENSARVTLAHVYDYVRWRLSKMVEAVRAKGGTPELDPAVSMLIELERRLRPLAKGVLALDRTDITVSDLLNAGGILILSFRAEVEGGRQVVMSEEMQKLLVWSILDHIYSRMLADRVTEGLRVMVIIDEGHKFLLGKRGEVPIGQHMRETRKFGASYVIITHLLDDLKQERDLARRRATPSVTSLIGTTVVFNVGGPEEVAMAADLLGLTEKEVRRLKGFHTGEAFIKWATDPRPLEFTVEPDKRALVRRRKGRRAMLYEMQ